MLYTTLLDTSKHNSVVLRPWTRGVWVKVLAQEADPTSPRPAPLGLVAVPDVDHHIPPGDWPQVPKHEVLSQPVLPRETWVFFNGISCQHTHSDNNFT